MISDARSMDRDKSIGLLQFYFEAEREIRGLDDKFLDLLKRSEGDVLLKMRSRMERMDNRDYIVLVAGRCMYALRRVERLNNMGQKVTKAQFNKVLMCFTQYYRMVVDSFSFVYIDCI